MLGINFSQICLHLFNVVILFGGLYLLLYEPVVKFMKKREDHYREMDDTAAKKLAEAESQQKEYEDKLKGAEEEISSRKAKAEAELEAEHERKVQEADKEAAKIIESAKARADKERKDVVDGARDDIYKIIQEAAAKVTLGKDTDAAYEAFLKDAERSAQDDGEEQ